MMQIPRSKVDAVRRLVQEVHREREVEIQLEVQLLLGLKVGDKDLGLIQGQLTIPDEGRSDFFRIAQGAKLKLLAAPIVRARILRDFEVENAAEERSVSNNQGIGSSSSWWIRCFC
jgi:hypothetical protein